MWRSYLKQKIDTFYLQTQTASFPGEEPYRFLFFWGVGKVPYNPGNTAGFSDVAQKHFNVGCPSITSAGFEHWIL